MSNKAEIKWSDTGISNKLRLKTIKYILNMDIDIKYVYFLRKNIPVEYRKKDKFKDSLLYTYIVGELLCMYLPIKDNEFRLFCDQRRLFGITKVNFINTIKNKLLLVSSNKNLFIQIDIVDSTSNINIQIVDWVSGVVSKYLENNESDFGYYIVLKDKISQFKELFK